jgi:hypothetical protein
MLTSGDLRVVSGSCGTTQAPPLLPTREPPSDTSPPIASPHMPDTSETPRQRATRERDEAVARVRQVMIESGDLIITDEAEFTKADKDTVSLDRAYRIFDILKESKRPVLVQEIADRTGAYYDDVLPFLVSWVVLDLVDRYEVKPHQPSAGRRRAVAYFLRQNNPGRASGS